MDFEKKNQIDFEKKNHMNFKKKNHMNFKKKIISIALGVVCAFGVAVPVTSNTTIFNEGISVVNAMSDADALANIKKSVAMGAVVDASGNLDYNYTNINVSARSYQTQGGGTISYKDLVTSEGLPNQKFNDLTGKEKERLLSDMYALAQATQERDSKNISDDTVNTWLVSLQNVDGIGSKLLTTILEDSKPDFVNAKHILQPFNGPINTAIGVVTILMMSLLGLTFALDLSYMVIPAIRMLLDPDGSGSAGASSRGQHKGKMKLISHEAIVAVQQAEGGSGSGRSQGGNENKVAVLIYFKMRIIALVALGLCLLYLIQGQIYSFVSWFLDLFSNLVGF